MNSTRISFTKDELIRLRALQGSAWGRYTKAYEKLDSAIKKIEATEESK